MSTLVVLVALLAADDDRADGSTEVRGNLATRVVFTGDEREKVTEACLELLASCHYSHVPNEGPMPDWGGVYADTFNTRSHLHVRLAKPREIKAADGETAKVTEMLVLFPLNNGGLWVRVGDKAKRFGKYEHDRCVALQHLLKHAESVE